MKMTGRVEALERRGRPDEIRNIQIVGVTSGQTNDEAIAEGGFDPNGDIIFLVGMTAVGAGRSLSDDRDAEGL